MLSNASVYTVPSYTPGTIHTRPIEDLRKHIEGIQIRSSQRRDTLEGILERQRREVLPKHNFSPLQSTREAASKILSESHYQPKPFRNKTADMLQNMGVGIAETLNRFCIPGYSAYVSGGSIPEVVASAGSDIALTLVGGKAAKMVAETKTIFRGAKPLLKNTTPQMPLIEKPVLLPSTKVADHHIFPQQFKKFFAERGIEINDYTVSLGQTTHLRGVHGKGNAGLTGKWNNKWEQFIESNPKATAKEVYQFAGKLMDEFNLNKEILHGYRK
jgi:hypothetical protein